MFPPSYMTLVKPPLKPPYIFRFSELAPFCGRKGVVARVGAGLVARDSVVVLVAVGPRRILAHVFANGKRRTTNVQSRSFWKRKK